MKLVNKISDLRNKYPESKPVEKNYVGNSIVGEYEQNKIQLKPDSFSDILEIPGSFKTLISLDGQLYGSSQYLKELRSSNNPYINKSNVAILKVSKNDLSNAQDFRVRENYAEVSINSTLSTNEDFINHIGWLLDQSQQELREPGVDYGSYTLNTTTFDIPTDSGLGFEFSDAAQQQSTRTQTSTSTQTESSVEEEIDVEEEQLIRDTTIDLNIDTSVEERRSRLFRKKQRKDKEDTQKSDFISIGRSAYDEPIRGGRPEQQYGLLQMPDIISIGPGSAGPNNGPFTGDRVPLGLPTNNTLSGGRRGIVSDNPILLGGRPESSKIISIGEVKNPYDIRDMGEPPGGLKRSRRNIFRKPRRG